MFKAIDTHVHPGTVEMYKASQPFIEYTKKYFKADFKIISIEETAETYRSQNIKAVLLARNAQSNLGLPAVSNEHVAEAVRNHPDVFIGFGSVDPWQGKWAVKEVEYAVKELNLKGMKFAQQLQGFFPNDTRFYPIYEKCQELKIPVLFHMGTTGIGAGAPGGAGIRLKYTQPIYIDDVAADFPELDIIAAHPAWPWTDEILAIAVHKANVYIDLSGWSPKYFPPSLIHYANSLLQDKCMFGSDYPLIKPQDWLTEFEKLNFKPEVIPKILHENARRLLQL